MLRVVAKAAFEERGVNRAARELLADELEQDFVDVVTEWRRQIDGRRVIEGAAQGSLGIIEEGLDIPRLQARFGAVYEPRLVEGVLQGAEIGARFAPATFGSVQPTVVTQAAQTFIADQSGVLITQIGDGTLGGIREVLDDVIASTISPEDAAQRIGRLAGLNPRQARAVENFRETLTSQLIPSLDADTPAVRQVIDDRVARFERRQLRARGRLIAETEMQTAIQAGERAYWEAAAEGGEVDRETVKKRWRTVQDGRVCPICRPLHTRPPIGFDESFATSVGMKLAPPAHPRCRCFLRYFVEGAEQAKGPQRAEEV